jgi:predicted HTH transcriptional regulator
MNINNLPKPKFEEFMDRFRVTLFKAIQKTTQITTQKMTLRVKFVSETV